MRELMIDFITSLDGYASGDGWPGWWGLEGPEYLAWLGEQKDGRERHPLDGRDLARGARLARPDHNGGAAARRLEHAFLRVAGLFALVASRPHYS